MARPLKPGIDYFPLDVGYLHDKKFKLLKGEFGAIGVLICIEILCQIYSENGYYKKWDDDDCFLMSEGVGCGCSPNLVKEVVAGCVKRGIFDEAVFNVFDVLTSAGIQRRYIRAISTREEIAFIKEYLLLDVGNKDDVPASIRHRISIKTVSLQNNRVNLQNNCVDSQINPQSRVKESKVKERSNAPAREDSHSPPQKLPESDFKEQYAELLRLYEKHAPTIHRKEFGKGLQEDYKICQTAMLAFDEGLKPADFVEAFRAAEASSWVKAAPGINFAWIAKHRKALMNGDYADFSGVDKTPKRDYLCNEYTKEELEAAFTSMEKFKL